MESQETIQDSVQSNVPESQTPEQIKTDAVFADAEAKAKELSAKYKTAVYPIILLSKECVQNRNAELEFVVGYARVPDLVTQLRLMDKGAGVDTGISLEACSQAMDSLILNEETDKRISSKKDFDYWKGACVSLSQYLGMAIPIVKKK